MDPAVKTAMAFCVLLGGVCAALLVGRDHGRPTPPNPAGAQKLLIPGNSKNGSGVFFRAPRRADRRARRGRFDGEYSPYPRQTQTEGDDRSLTMLSPAEGRPSPPPLSEEYPRSSRAADSRWGRSMDTMLPLPPPAEQRPRTHKIVDGDTLASLAERYLGSASRAGEIFQANRDVLMDPQLLPIGAELKIPSK